MSGSRGSSSGWREEPSPDDKPVGVTGITSQLKPQQRCQPLNHSSRIQSRLALDACCIVVVSPDRKISSAYQLPDSAECSISCVVWKARLDGTDILSLGPRGRYIRLFVEEISVQVLQMSWRAIHRHVMLVCQPCYNTAELHKVWQSSLQWQSLLCHPPSSVGSVELLHSFTTIYQVCVAFLDIQLLVILC